MVGPPRPPHCPKGEQTLSPARELLPLGARCPFADLMRAPEPSLACSSVFALILPPKCSVLRLSPPPPPPHNAPAPRSPPDLQTPARPLCTPTNLFSQSEIISLISCFLIACSPPPPGSPQRQRLCVLAGPAMVRCLVGDMGSQTPCGLPMDSRAPEQDPKWGRGSTVRRQSGLRLLGPFHAEPCVS